MYLFLCIISIRTQYVNRYTVACNARNSVAYNTTRRRLFCFPVLIKFFLLDNNIQKVDTFHRCNVSRAVPARRGTARAFYNLNYVRPLYEEVVWLLGYSATLTCGSFFPVLSRQSIFIYAYVCWLLLNVKTDTHSNIVRDGEYWSKLL